MGQKCSSRLALTVTICILSMLFVTALSAQDEVGMAKELGAATWGRCAEQMTRPGARSYELSYPRSASMPLSPMAGPYEPNYLPTIGLPGTTQVFNMDVMNEGANPGQQGTQIDAFGHFATLDEAWDGTSELAADSARYYGGLSQKDVKPTPDSPLLKLGIENIPPLVTTAVLLNAREHINGGEPMEAGALVTSEHIEAMLEAHGLAERGILPGDIVLVYTGWSDHYQDPDTEGVYYSKAPGLSYDAAKYLGDKRVVAAGLDTPFVDAVNDGQLAGTAGPPEAIPETAFPVHAYFLTQAGIHTLENTRLKELAQDQVSLSCAMVLPVLSKGAAGAAIRPVAIGVPGR